MLFLAVDVTNHLEVIFEFINNIYLFLDSLKFTAFGFEFSFLGIMLSLIILIALIKFMKFGFETEASSTIKYNRAENKRDKKLEENGKSRWI